MRESPRGFGEQGNKEQNIVRKEPGNLNFFKGTQEQGEDVKDGGGGRLKTDMLNREEI